ncbi:bud emergence protein 1 [Serendipita sp. 396]|nr:bud emergence protein 1 [Serendipita sp. 396]
MKSLGIRRSAKETAPTNAAYSPQTLPTLSKPVSATVPPKKVIRALNSYRASAPQELSFTKGDFFYVIREVTHTNGNDYYEAHNPVTGSRGIVPREMFEGFDKANAAQRVVSTSGPGARISGPVSPPQAIRYSNNPSSPKATAVFYAVVQHDFQAERPDELDARAGDAISVVAHSNREWFVAKPIGKLGGPGLIPASFLEVRDPHTGQAIADLDELIDRGELPPVEEWKRATMSYKANSIALGVVDSPSGQEPSHPYARAKPAVTQDRDSRASGDSGGYNRKSEAERSRGWNEPAHPYAREASGGSRGTEPSVSSPTSRYNNPPFGSPRRQNISPQQSPYAQSRDSEYKGHNSTYSTAMTNVGSSGNPNSPRISVSNPNAAFVKIKIFHSSTDELIAIRVSPRVSRRQLMEKIRERLGNNVENVKYRDGMATGSGGTGHFVDVADDGHLREWMSSGDKLVLYAE